MGDNSQRGRYSPIATVRAYSGPGTVRRRRQWVGPHENHAEVKFLWSLAKGRLDQPIFYLSIVFTVERDLYAKNRKKAPDMVREYKIGNTAYVVSSRSKETATEDAVTKVKRLIRNDLRKNVSS